MRTRRHTFTKRALGLASMLRPMLLTAASAQGQTAEDIYAQSTPIQHLAKYKADMEMTAVVKLGKRKTESKSRGVQYGATTDGLMRQRTEIHSSETGAGTTLINTVTVTADNKVLQIFPKQKRVIEMSTDAPVDPYTLELAQILADVGNFSLKMRRDTLDGADVYVLDMALSKPALQKQAAAAKKMNAKMPIIARQERWVDAESHIILQFLSYDKEGTLITGTKYSNIETDIDLAPNLFSAPADFARVEVANTAKLVEEVVKETIAASVVSVSDPQQPGRRSGFLVTFLTINAFALFALLIWMYRRKRSQAALDSK